MKVMMILLGLLYYPAQLTKQNISHLSRVFTGLVSYFSGREVEVSVSARPHSDYMRHVSLGRDPVDVCRQLPPDHREYVRVEPVVDQQDVHSWRRTNVEQSVFHQYIHVLHQILVQHLFGYEQPSYRWLIIGHHRRRHQENQRDQFRCHSV